MKIGKLILNLLLAGITARASVAVADELTLVKNGSSEYVIVLSSEASPAEKWAAEELVSHIKQMSGAQLTVQGGGEAPDKAILLGDGPMARKLLGDVNLGELGEEGYILKTIGQRLVMVGGRPRGTLYGVYTLLEKLGVRWWTPTESTIPNLKTIFLPEINLREVPRLVFRDMMYHECFSSIGKLWMARNKLNGLTNESGPDEEKYGGRYEHVGGHFLHGCNELLKKSGVPLKPEMWALVDGKHLPNTQPCLSNPDVLAAVATAAIQELKQHPQAKFVAVSQDEEGRFGYCQCAQCATVGAKEGPSGLAVQFANQVAAIVEKEVPDGRIVVGAYGWSCEPPKTIKPRDNVIIAFDPLTCDYAHPLASRHDDDVNITHDETKAKHYFYRPGENKRIRREIEGWSKISTKLILYDYTLGDCTPYPDLDCLVPNIKYYADHGFTGIFTLGSLKSAGADFYGLRMWVIAKALWNPAADGRALLSDFLQGYYGAAAPAIQKYMDVIHQSGRERKDYYLTFAGTLGNALHLRAEILANAEQALREADKLAAGNPELESRVRHAHMPIWYMLARRGPESVAWKTTETKVGKMELRELAKKLAVVYQERNTSVVGPPFLDWLNDYARQSEKGRVIPAELQGVDPQKYGLVQACQMDGDARFWGKIEGASDGWCEVLGQPTFGVWVGLTPGENYIPGRKYKLFARVKGEGKASNGVACVFSVVNSAVGEANKNQSVTATWPMAMGLGFEEARKLLTLSKDVLADDLADGQFHVVEIGEVVNPAMITFNLPYPSSAMTSVCLDCFWLMEVPNV